MPLESCQFRSHLLVWPSTRVFIWHVMQKHFNHVQGLQDWIPRSDRMVPTNICHSADLYSVLFLWFSVVMERLVNELGSLLKMLDHETVSPATADKMASIRNILDSLQLSGTELSHKNTQGGVHNTFKVYISRLISAISVINPFKCYYLHNPNIYFWCIPIFLYFCGTTKVENDGPIMGYLTEFMHPASY